jgi:hypothetical protein
MSQTFQFYAARAQAAETAAAEAQLSNVRERELRSAKAWRELADRQLLIDNERAKAEVLRAERIASEGRDVSLAAPMPAADGARA